MPDEQRKTTLRHRINSLGINLRKRVISYSQNTKIFDLLAEAGEKLDAADNALKNDFLEEAERIMTEAEGMMNKVGLYCIIEQYRAYDDEPQKQVIDGKLSGSELTEFLLQDTGLLDRAEELLNQGKTDEAVLAIKDYQQRRLAVLGKPS